MNTNNIICRLLHTYVTNTNNLDVIFIPAMKFPDDDIVFLLDTDNVICGG